MRPKLKTLFLNYFSLSIMLFLTSCAMTEQLTIPKDIDITPIKLSAKIPLRVGLYLSEDFRNATYPMHLWQGGYFGSAFAGDALCNSSEKIMQNIFQEVIILDSTKKVSETTSQRYDVIIAPQIVNLDYEIRTSGLTGWHIVQTVIKWDIASYDGKDIYIGTMKSDEIRVKNPGKSGRIELCLKPSLKDNFQKAQEDLYTNGWWKKQWWKDSK
jgi:hypothetical protein